MTRGLALNLHRFSAAPGVKTGASIACCSGGATKSAPAVRCWTRTLAAGWQPCVNDMPATRSPRPPPPPTPKMCLRGLGGGGGGLRIFWQQRL